MVDETPKISQVTADSAGSETKPAEKSLAQQMHEWWESEGQFKYVSYSDAARKIGMGISTFKDHIEGKIKNIDRMRPEVRARMHQATKIQAYHFKGYEKHLEGGAKPVIETGVEARQEEKTSPSSTAQEKSEMPELSFLKGLQGMLGAHIQALGERRGKEFEVSPSMEKLVDSFYDLVENLSYLNRASKAERDSFKTAVPGADVGFMISAFSNPSIFLKASI